MTTPVPEFAKKPLEALRKISMEKNNPIRTNNLYISSQLHRWLKWLEDLEPTGFEITSDALAEAMLREIIVHRYPSIEQLEAEYWSARSKLDAETVKKLKGDDHKKSGTGASSFYKV